VAHFFTPAIIEQRAFGKLYWLTLQSPELASGARPGQYLLLRCAAPQSYDPLLRRTLFVAGADRANGVVSLLYAPDERGTAWLAQRSGGEQIDIFGPLGTPFNLDNRTRSLLLIGAGPGLGALFFLAHEAVARDCTVVLLAAAANDLLPPPFLLPPDVEYQASPDGEDSALELLEVRNTDSSASAALQSPISWADQLCAALPSALFITLADRIRSTKLRWQNGFAQALLADGMPCGIGVCQSCLVETRHGLRTRCKDGPVFDLRELR
jgi:dihydroorotate dehydrogenase electron transfer subunit